LYSGTIFGNVLSTPTKNSTIYPITAKAGDSFMHFIKPIFPFMFTGCLAVALLCSSCENSIAEVEALNAKGLGKDEAKNVTIRYSIAAQKKAVLTGPIMYRVQDTSSFVEFPNTVHVDFFSPQGVLESKLDAKYAKYKDTQSKVFLKDSVRVTNIMGDTLFCDELYWDRNRTGAEFYTDKPVRIRRKTEIIDGIGMEAKQDFTDWYIIKPIGFIKVANNGLPN
jgi:LPS export ABC transporter protein LptC